MNTRRMISASLLVLLTGILFFILSGCSILPPLSPARTEKTAPAALELHLGSILPEDLTLTWDPDAVAVDSAEASVTEEGISRTVTVTIQLHQP